MLISGQRSRIRRFASAWHERFSGRRRPAVLGSHHGVPALRSVPLSGHHEYIAYRDAHKDEYDQRRQVSGPDHAYGPNRNPRVLLLMSSRAGLSETPFPGYDTPDPGVPNWREGMICPVCSLNSRMRAAVHMMREWLAPATDSRIYFTEQVTAFISGPKPAIRPVSAASSCAMGPSQGADQPFGNPS